MEGSGLGIFSVLLQHFPGRTVKTKPLVRTTDSRLKFDSGNPRIGTLVTNHSTATLVGTRLMSVYLHGSGFSVTISGTQNMYSSI
jgi:hypothetical protein